MKTDEVPQDGGQLAEKNITELCYAVDENGNYTTAQSSGWTPKTIALEQQMQTLQQRIDEARKAVAEGEKSSIAYYMELHRMDLPTLADYVGKWQWQVKRHLKPSIFKSLSIRVLEKYAAAFEISVGELKDFDGK
ncbi:MAG: hypothetical protein Q4G08_00285 [Capnocytophaga sp.]|nr:hypothetical protein [Capnocytophaga sp.]